MVSPTFARSRQTAIGITAAFAPAVNANNQSIAPVETTLTEPVSTNRKKLLKRAQRMP